MMRSDIYSAIRRNIFYRGTHLSHHDVVEVLADILSGQVEIIKANARLRRTDSLG